MSFGLNFFSIPQPVILRERSDRRIFLTPRKYEILRGAQDHSFKSLLLSALPEAEVRHFQPFIQWRYSNYSLITIHY
jgi:hypothetical protein